MDLLDSWLIIFVFHDPISEVRSNSFAISRGKCLSHSPRSNIAGNNVVRGMGAPKSRRQKLLPEHMNMVSHWKLVMEMSDGSGDVAARRDAQCRVLDDL